MVPKSEIIKMKIIIVIVDIGTFNDGKLPRPIVEF